MDPHRLLYQAAPRPIRDAYGEVVRAGSWTARHGGLLALVEASLDYLAAIAFSDYRSGSGAPARPVESLLDHARAAPLTVGRALELLKTSVAATADPLFPDQADSGEPLEAVARFAAAMQAIEAAVEGLQPGTSPSVVNVRWHVERAVIDDQPIGWWEAWNRIKAYRNKAAHSGRERWPLQSEGYDEVMAPLLHDALVAVLDHPGVVAGAYRCAVVNLTTPVKRLPSGEFMHQVCGELDGVWFSRDIIEPADATSRWSDEHWNATETSKFLVERRPGGELSFRALYWDLSDSPPPAIGGPAPNRDGATGRAPRRPRAADARSAREGRGTAVGTCGEFVQGTLPDGTPFHVTCPINKSATVIARLEPASHLEVTGLLDHHRKLGLAVEYAAELLEIGPARVAVRHWSDLDVGKGMGSSTADVLAAVRALADAAGARLGPDEEGELAARVESSDGTMHFGIAVVNHQTCRKIRDWDWFPEFTIVMLVPHDNVDTNSIKFTGQRLHADDYALLLANLDEAVANRDIAGFAAQATVSAALNDPYLLNPYTRALTPRLGELGALGLNVGHTGTVCGLLFPNTDDGHAHASDACFEVRRRFPELKDVKVVTTPRWSPDALLTPGAEGSAR